MSGVELGALITIFAMAALVLWGQFGYDEDDNGHRR